MEFGLWTRGRVLRDQRLHWRPLWLHGEHGHLILSLKMGDVGFFSFGWLEVGGDPHSAPEPRVEAAWPGLTSIHSAPPAVTRPDSGQAAVGERERVSSLPCT